MTERLAVRLAEVARAMRAILGVPDYERYVSHLRAVHPEVEPMTCEQFYEERTQNRYSRPGTRCC